MKGCDAMSGAKVGREGQVEYGAARKKKKKKILPAVEQVAGQPVQVRARRRYSFASLHNTNF